MSSQQNEFDVPTTCAVIESHLYAIKTWDYPNNWATDTLNSYLEKFLIHFLISIVIMTFTLNGLLNSPRVSAMFTLTIIFIILNRFFMGYINEKQ